MKTTHSLEQVEALMWKESNILMDSNVGKEAKKEARRRLKLLEKHFQDCKDKELNGKKYPVKKVPEEISKKELLALIDSVEPTKGDYDTTYPENAKYRIERELDVTGVFVK